jgi:hypothetical protein
MQSSTGWPEKFVKNVAKRVVLSKLINNFYILEKVAPVWTASVCNKKLPKEYNRPMGENSPNLVTLILDNLERGQRTKEFIHSIHVNGCRHGARGGGGTGGI